jgi:outer membrane protein assembly factor BamB
MRGWTGLTALGIVFALQGLLTLGHAADWPQFRGPTGMGVSPSGGAPVSWSADKNVLWKADLPGPGTSTPVLFGDRIYVTCYTGFGIPGERGSMDDLKLHVAALDRRNGKLIWSREVQPDLPEQDRIREEHGYASNTPAVAADGVYAFFGKSGVVKFDRDGKQLWRTRVGSGLHGWGSGTSVVLHGDLVIVNASVESESLVALDRRTGKEVWRAGGIKESWNTPILVQLPGGKTELVVAIQGKILGFDPATGQELWSCATDIGWYMVPCLVAHDGVVYCVGGRSGGGLAVRAGGRGDVTQSHRLWTIRKGSNVTSPVFHDGHLYWMHESLGIAYCAEAKTGKIVYEQRLDRADQVYAAAVLADGKIYYVTRSGPTFVVAARPTFEKLATNTLGVRGRFDSSPAIADGRLYLRTDRTLYCLGEK